METIARALASARFIDVCPPPLVARNFADVLRQHSVERPDDLAYIFLNFGRAPDLIMTYRDVDAGANRVAHSLLARGLEGRNIVLAYPSAQEFVEAFFGCLYAGCVAVPALPPDDDRERKRLIGILRDCDPGLVLTAREKVAEIRTYFQGVGCGDIECAATADFPEGDAAFDVAKYTPDRLAFLQYTSGSTAEPKGVMVSHANLLHNEELIVNNLGARDIRWLALAWLPHYHDMGLIGGILQSVYIGRPVVLFSTTDFLAHPTRWLKLVSDLGASVTGAPNFAYDLCLKRSKRFDTSSLDLSCWLIAFTGAEPVRHETLGRFLERFGPCGLRPESIVPGYGLAEGTLMVTGHRRNEPLALLRADYESLVHGRFVPAQPVGGAVTLVGNGLVGRQNDQDIRIIDPESGEQVEDGVIGEICVRGGSVCGGYYRKPELSEQTFHAHRALGGGEGFLRTGDLGFIGGDRELFVTGRLKDLVICNGANHYPQDIELIVVEACSQIRNGRVAVFNVNAGPLTCVVAVGEVSGGVEQLDTMAGAIRDAVASQAGISLAGVVFIAKGAMPLTSSGKIRRSECRNLYLSRNIKTVHEWYGPAWREALEARRTGGEPAGASLVV